MQDIEHLKTQALSLMEKADYRVREEVLLEVDPKLPFMGYTSERNGKTLIVISAWSLKTDMAMGLIIHELSHVYRIETAHPSHNSSLHTKALSSIFQDRRVYPYQEEAMHTIINHIQDLYADDISFRVYIKKSQKGTLNEFFLGWIHPPLTSHSTPKDKWKNAELLLSAAFAQANLKRHDVADTGGKVEKAVNDFLSHTDKKQAKKFEYFQHLMTHLPENITDETFTKHLSTYLSEFLKLTE